MTATIERTETDHVEKTMYDPATLPGGTALLLDTLQAAVAAVAHVDPEDLGSWTPAGRELLGLAAVARAATAALGGQPGGTVTEAPGVVVVRELVAATRTLSAAIA